MLSNFVLAANEGASHAAAGAGAVLFLLGVVLAIAFGIIFYFAPTAVAAFNKHPHVAGIIVLNVLFGWTLIGWVAAFIWAFIKPMPPQVIIQQIPASIVPSGLPPTPPVKNLQNPLDRVPKGPAPT